LRQGPFRFCGDGTSVIGSSAPESGKQCPLFHGPECQGHQFAYQTILLPPYIANLMQYQLLAASPRPRDRSPNAIIAIFASRVEHAGAFPRTRSTATIELIVTYNYIPEILQENKQCPKSHTLDKRLPLRASTVSSYLGVRIKQTVLPDICAPAIPGSWLWTDDRRSVATPSPAGLRVTSKNRLAKAQVALQ
jgi:hypothetical protein